MRHARYHTGRVFSVRSVYGSSSSEIHQIPGRLLASHCLGAASIPPADRQLRHCASGDGRRQSFKIAGMQNLTAVGLGPFAVSQRNEVGNTHIAFNPDCGVLEYVGSSMHYPIRHQTFYLLVRGREQFTPSSRNR